MKYLILLLIIFCLLIIYYKSIYKQNKPWKSLPFTKRNFYSWMKLPKKERYHQTRIESYDYLNRRKILLAQIREEYKNISKNKNKFD